VQEPQINMIHATFLLRNLLKNSGASISREAINRRKR